MNGEEKERSGWMAEVEGCRGVVVGSGCWFGSKEPTDFVVGSNDGVLAPVPLLLC